ncbi:hypothetical protein SAMN05216499_10484 [Actinacidiphila paucisporea]|uniref:Uncharacterized protein n=1 Tax=Actinacidiphila paucisporea TaxID=310782 RepID=A0A1M7AFJ6_9ACTN|nr:hypothetical protein SAMN05216499_10484 [Actinacidiphila paucisporea]
MSCPDVNCRKGGCTTDPGRGRPTGSGDSKH